MKNKDSHPSQCLGRLIRMPPTPHSDASQQAKKYFLTPHRRYSNDSFETFGRE